MQDIFYEKKSFLKLANEFLSLAFKRKVCKITLITFCYKYRFHYQFEIFYYTLMNKNLANTYYYAQIFSESKDEFGLIFFGANETKNELSEGGKFQNVSVAFNPSKYHLDVLKCLSEELPLGFHKSDCILL